MSANTTVGVDSYIAREFANNWVQQQSKKHRELTKVKHHKQYYEYARKNPMQNMITETKQFACRKSTGNHISTMVFTIFYDKDGNAIDGAVEQRITTADQPSYFTHDFFINIDGREVEFTGDGRYSMNMLRAVWHSLVNKSIAPFVEIPDWNKTHTH